MKVAFLGYRRDRTHAIGVLERLGCAVDHVEDKLADLSDWDRVASFGYRHILPPQVLSTARVPVANLHISWLPWNRGAHPAFWAFVEGTPQGVTIHEMTRGLDTGPILARRQVDLDPVGLTLRAGHAALTAAMEALFEEVAADWLAGRLVPDPQGPGGSYHAVRDLPAWMDDWDMPVTEALRRARDG